MKNPKSILMPVFPSEEVLFQACANPTGKEDFMKLKGKAEPLAGAVSGSGEAGASPFAEDGARMRH